MSKIPELKNIAILYEDNKRVFAFDCRKDIENINRVAKKITPCQREHYIVQLDIDNKWIDFTIEQFILISDQLIYIDRHFEKEKAKEKSYVRKNH